MGNLTADNIFATDAERANRMKGGKRKGRRVEPTKRHRPAEDEDYVDKDGKSKATDDVTSAFRPKETLRLIKMARSAQDEMLGEGSMDEESEHETDQDESSEGSMNEDELEYETATETMTEVDGLDDNAYDMLDDEDKEAFSNFQPKNSEYRGTLADIILAKLKSNKEKKLQNDDAATSVGNKLDPKIVRVYRAVGKVLNGYTHGRLPKAFKMMPRLTNWEELLWLTKPQDWSPSALYVATRLFVSNLNEAMTQRFFYVFLLPSIVAAFESPKAEAKVALHPQRYNAIRKAMFKPMAFVRGFLIPLFEECEPSVQLTVIIASAIKKGTLQPLAVALSIVKISAMSYSPSRTLILRVILEKKTKLPEQAKDAMLTYFFSFLQKGQGSNASNDKVTVIWHQLLLSYLTCYEIHEDHVPLFRDLCHKFFHPILTPESLRLINRTISS